MLKILSLLLLLACPVQAGTHTFTQPGSSSVSLGQAPVWATGISVRITEAAVDFGVGFENTHPTLPATSAGQATHGYSVKADGVTLASDRVVSGMWSHDYAPWDGVIDYAGESGWTYHEWKVKTQDTAWGTYLFSTPPTELVLSKRTLYDYSIHPQWGWNYLGTSSLITVEWEWQ